MFPKALLTRICPIAVAVWLTIPAWIPRHGLAQTSTADPAQPSQGNRKSETTEETFVYLSRGADDEPIALNVAITRFVPRSRSSRIAYVDLVSAIHVADQAYYQELNRRFRDYDAVLYELVAPEGTRVPKGGVPRDSAVSWLQGGMTKILGLTFQLDEVDYTRKNFVHADMTPSEFAKSMEQRGESMLSIMTRIFMQGLSQQATKPGNVDEVKLLAALVSADREHALKVFMAEQFADMEDMMGIFEGSEGSTLVTERNKKAISVLKREMNRGKRRIAIFYGAAHMKDMARQLESEIGLRRAATTWLVAWDLSRGKTPLGNNSGGPAATR